MSGFDNDDNEQKSDSFDFPEAGESIDQFINNLIASFPGEVEVMRMTPDGFEVIPQEVFLNMTPEEKRQLARENGEIARQKMIEEMHEVEKRMSAAQFN